MPHVGRGTGLGKVACADPGSTHTQANPTIQAANPNRRTLHTIHSRRTTDDAVTRITTKPYAGGTLSPTALLPTLLRKTTHWHSRTTSTRSSGSPT